MFAAFGIQVVGRLVLRRHNPCRGVSDTLVTYLRRRHGARGYVGLEVRSTGSTSAARWRALVAQLTATLAAAVTTP